MFSCNIATSCLQSVSTIILVTHASKPAVIASTLLLLLQPELTGTKNPQHPFAISIHPLLSRATHPAPPFMCACVQAPSQLNFIQLSVGFCQIRKSLQSHSGGEQRNPPARDKDAYRLLDDLNLEGV
ncbi:hypothetical protein L3X38_036985 [Prunus dulcis]|uniref:Uncharacterized protein n=1 Tax=Prunus dulcis TaxID=3755 RepID=A0AAD4V3N3_PRUDU|nr:hypothetical protein L3X38_036985 [Prunus dulcis]